MTTDRRRTIQYNFCVCRHEEVEKTLVRMRSDGWHPVSHSTWHDPKEQATMTSFIFKRGVNG